MKNNLTEARLQFLAGVINENEFKQLDKSATEAISSFPPFEVIVERGELNDEKETEAKFVQILFFDKEEGDMLDVDTHPDYAYLNKFGAGIWTMEPLEKYDGDEYDYEFTNGSMTFEFNTADEVENFMKTDLKGILQDF
jgi:hypothetical protein